jgi:hypothetical protein
MLTLFEKAVSLIGNIVSVLGFVLAILEKLGLYSAGTLKVSDRRSATVLVVAFVFFASYAMASSLAAWKRKEREVLLLWFPMLLAYVMTFWFLLENFLPLGANASQTLDVRGVPVPYTPFFLAAIGVNAALMAWLYYWRQAYPGGHSVWASPEKGSAARLGFIGVHLFALVALLLVLSP